MVNIGKINELVCVKKVDFGAYLDGGSDGEILLPIRYMPEDLIPGDKLSVFIYKDSEDRLIATTETPVAQVGDIAFLTVTDTNNMGAFADWGLPKELLIPFREQHAKLKKGGRYPVAILLDRTTRRIIGSSKINKYIDNVPIELEEGEEVDLLVWEEHELGFKVIINLLYSGIIYKNELFKPVQPGDTFKGYIKKVREDEKIDCSLTAPGIAKTTELTEQIIEALNNNGGSLNISDKSSPETIKEQFMCSKKAFKMALGILYKQKKIMIEPKSIRLVKKGL